MAQENLFHGEHLPTFPCALRYHQLFQCLLRFTTESATGRGRPAVNRDALLRALIYRALRRFAALTDLVRALQENPFVLEAVDRSPRCAGQLCPSRVSQRDFLLGIPQPHGGRYRIRKDIGAVQMLLDLGLSGSRWSRQR